MIRLDAPEVTALLGELTDAAGTFDGRAAGCPTNIDAGAASQLVSEVVSVVLDSSIRLVGECAAVIERAESAMNDFSAHERDTAAGLGGWP